MIIWLSFSLMIIFKWLCIMTINGCGKVIFLIVCIFLVYSHDKALLVEVKLAAFLSCPAKSTITAFTIQRVLVQASPTTSAHTGLSASVIDIAMMCSVLLPWRKCTLWSPPQSQHRTWRSAQFAASPGSAHIVVTSQKSLHKKATNPASASTQCQHTSLPAQCQLPRWPPA